MKTLASKFGIAGMLALLCIPALGQPNVPTYTTLNASGTTTATVYFATSPFMQVRVVTAIASSDLATANLTLRTGVTPLTIIKTNTAGTTIDVAATNGFATGDWVLVETAAGVLTNGTIASFTGATNIVFGGNVCATVPGDQIYRLSSPVTLSVGAVTNKTYTGDMIYVGNRGRPVVVKINGTSGCTLDAITARYE
ncbi:MAG: hypothetical protein NT167_22375 [Verrucomicrobia bacterium]|nr:hypothetical protein [Verrucomicrobiota bacterium]